MLLLILATLAIAAIPLVMAMLTVGTAWQGVLPSNDNYYYTRIHEIKDGHPFLGNPYFYEHRNETSPAFFLADWIASIPYLIGVPLVATVVFNHFFWSVLNTLLFYAFLRAVGLSKNWSAGGSLLVYMMAFVLIVRPVSMQVVYPAFTILALAAVRWLQSPSERRRTIIFSFAIALSVYMYTYLAQVGIAFAGILIALFFLQKKWNEVKSLIFVLSGAFMLSLPFVWYVYRQVSHPFYWESMVRIGLVNTRLPTLNAFTIMWWVAVLLGLLYISHQDECSKERDKYTNLFFVIAGIALVVVSFSNVITNKELETAEHIERFVIVWFGLGLVYALSRFTDYVRSPQLVNWIRRSIYVGLIALSCVGAFQYMRATGLLVLFLSDISGSMDSLRDDQSEARALAWLEQHETESRVIWAPFNSSINDNIEINTKHYTLFSMGGILHLVSDKETEERFLTAGYLNKFTIEDIENNFKLFAGAGNAVHAYKTHNRGVLVCRLLQVERFGGHCGELTDAISYKGVDYFQRLYQQYAEEIRPNITDKLKKFHVAYIVTDAKIPGQESVSDITGIEKVYADERFIIYKLP